MRVYCSDFFARDIGKWIEFQPRPVLFDDRNGRPRSALKAFSAIEPCAKRRERPRQGLNLADTTARIRISEPQFAIGVFVRQRLLRGA